MHKRICGRVEEETCEILADQSRKPFDLPHPQASTYICYSVEWNTSGMMHTRPFSTTDIITHRVWRCLSRHRARPDLTASDTVSVLSEGILKSKAQFRSRSKNWPIVAFFMLLSWFRFCDFNLRVFKICRKRKRNSSKFPWISQSQMFVSVHWENIEEILMIIICCVIIH